LGVVQPSKKHWESATVCAAILNNGKTSRLLQPTAMLRLVYLTLRFPSWKIRPLRCGLFQNYLTTCCYY